jgi:hypothetical protein
MTSDGVREEWGARLPFADWQSAIGNEGTLIARAGSGPFIAHVRAIDDRTAEVLKRRPEGVETQINLYALRPGDDVSVLDSRVLAVLNPEPIDPAPLHNLPATVESLVLGGVVNRTQRLRVGDLPSVRSLAADWRGLDLSRGYGRSLRCLSVDNYGRVDTSELAADKCEQIQSLSIIQSRSLKDLGHLKSFRALSHLTLYGCRGLSDFSPLSRLSSLRHLTIEGCRGLDAIDGILTQGLETLAVTDCGTIRSIAPVAGLPMLERLAVDGDTVVEDRDLSPLLRLARLHSVLVASRRGYTPAALELQDQFGWRPISEPC